MSGTNSGFDAAEFRSSIQDAMLMGLPNSSSDMPTFLFEESSPVYPLGTALDENGRPYDLTIKPTSTPLANVKIKCAVEYGGQNSQNLESVGEFDETKAILTVLDEDYELVKEADYVLLGTDRYQIRYRTVIGLFNVDVWRLYLYAVDET